MVKEDEVEKRKKKLEEEQKKLDEEQKTKEHPDDKIARAEAAAERIEEVSKVAAQQIEELRALKVNTALGGETEAGAPPPEKKEETAGEYAEKVMAGETDG